MNHIYDILIVGGGPAGYTSALYAARAGLDAVVLEKLAPGGQMALSHQIDNYPGFVDGIDGFSLAQQMQQGAERFGAQTVMTEVHSLDLTGDIKTAHTSDGDYLGRTVILATGANPRPLGVPQERELVGRGVSYCAACDGMFFRNRTVVVVGGGNSAAADAKLLSRVAKQVIIIHRRNTMRADQIDQQALQEADNVQFLWNSVVTELLHDDCITGVRVRNVESGQETVVPCDGVFVSIGRKPATELLGGQITLDQNGYIDAGESLETNVLGVYAVGDVRRKDLRQVVTAVSDGAAAVHQIEAYLTKEGQP